MTRLRRILIVVAALIVIASVSFTTPRSLLILDDAERPVEGGYIAYHHEGERLNPVHPVTYQASRHTVLRSDSAGRVRIPAALHVHLPFPLQTHPHVVIDLVYSPRLHNASASVRSGSPSVQGVFVIDWTKGRFTMTDLASRPERWEATLSNLTWVIHYFYKGRDGEGPELRRLDPTTAARVAELIADFRREYADFLNRYRDVDRPKPELPLFLTYGPEEERQRWRKMTDEQLAKEPTWGPLVQRMYGRELQALAAFEGELLAGR